MQSEGLNLSSLNSAKQITYGGIATALATLSMLLGGLAPIVFSFLPFVVCPLCFFIAIKKVNWVVGVLSMAVTGLLTFFILGFRAVLILEYLLFTIPHSFFVVFADKFKYDLKTGGARALLVAGLSLVGSTVGIALFFDLLGYKDAFGLAGFALFVVLYVFNAITLVVVDFLYTVAAASLYPRFFKMVNLNLPVREKPTAEDIFD